MQRVSSELTDQLVIVQFCPLLLRKKTELIDGDDHLEEQLNTFHTYFSYFLWSELMSLLLLCFSVVLSVRGWYTGISDDRILRNSAAFSRQFDSNIHLVCHRKFRTTSFRIQPPRKTAKKSFCILIICLWIIYTWFIISFCIPYNVVEHWHEDDPACEVLWFTVIFQTSVDSDPWKIIHSNFTSCRSIRFKYLK